MSKRKVVPDAIQTAILTKSRRRCCLCFGLDHVRSVVAGQIAHLDHNSENWNEDNLAYLCFSHHNEYDSTQSQAKGLRENEVRHWRDVLYQELERIPIGDNSTSDQLGTATQRVHVHNPTGNVFVGDGHSINFTSPPPQADSTGKPIVRLRLAVTKHPMHGMVHMLVIEFQNRSDKNVFLGNFFLELTDSILICPFDRVTGEPQQKRKVEPGDKYSFHITEFDLREVGRPAIAYLSAGVSDVVGQSYRTGTEEVQKHVADLLREPNA